MIKKKIAGIGELLWDVLPQGKQLGGAPCNFAFHAMQAGNDAYVISAIGSDPDGEEILGVMDQLTLRKDYIQINTEYPTGTVTVTLDEEGIPAYTIHENVAWDYMEWNESLKKLAPELDAVCFGSLAQRSEVSGQSIRTFLEATQKDCLRVYDINLRQAFYHKENILRSLELSNVLKLNEDELPVLAGFLELEGDEESILRRMLSDHQLKLIAYTKGGEGSWLITQEEISQCEVPPVKIADTVGAGDSFTATLLAGILNELPLTKIHKIATDVAAYVCSQHGATPRLPSELLEQLSNGGHN
jgi:fructokinase